MALPVGNGFQWTYLDGGAGPATWWSCKAGTTMSRLCGRGKSLGRIESDRDDLKCDAHRLEVATKLSADHTVMVNEHYLVDAVNSFSDSMGVDPIVNVASGGSRQVVGDGLKVLKKARTLYDGGQEHVDGSVWGKLIAKQITLSGARGRSYRAVELAFDLMRRRTIPLETMSTHPLPPG
jgi:D-arabinose 1-dehydrogenase-like Zn-dependent alcohol dehydrogenase